MAGAETIVRKQVTYFSIGGTTAADLDREMMKRGPLLHSGARHPGATRIRFSGTATFVSKDGKCSIGGARVTLNTKITLPRWKNRAKASKQMATLWDTLSADIKRHEERHAEIARNHARGFEKQILGLGSAKTCDVLKEKVNELSREAMSEHDEDQKRFDRIEAANFDNRMIRLLKYRSQTAKSP
jgi:predicted secreted Zn-dependent protease